MLTRNEFILVELENAYGVDAVPTAADVIFVTGAITPNPAEAVRFADRPIQRGTLGMARPILGGSLFSLQFTVEMKGSGTVDTPPPIGKLLRIMGCAETITPSTSVAYSPVSTNHDSASIYYFQDGLRYRLTGCRVSNMSFSVEAGGVIAPQFTVVGFLTSGDPTDTAVPSLTFDSIVPPTFRAANMFTLSGSFNPEFASFSYDQQNTLITPANANAAEGFGELRITGRDPRGSFDPNMALKATRDWIGGFKAQTSSTLAFVLGQSGGERFTWSFPKISNTEPGFGDRDGIRTFEYGYKADETSGDDEWTLTFD